MDKREIIEKLKALQALMEQLLQYGDYYENGCAEYAAKKISEIKSQLGTLPGVPSVVNAMPVFPEGEQAYKTAKEETDKSRSYTVLAAAVTGVLAIIMLISKAALVVFLTLVAGVVCYMVGKTHKLNKEGLAKKEKAYLESVQRHRVSMEKFRQALSAYPREANDGFAAAKAYGQRYREKQNEIFDVVEDFEAKRNAALDQCTALVAQIKAHDYISEDYHHHVPKLITLLQSGRADSYKEALNIAVAEEQQEKYEEARQVEEARRQAMLQMQMEEERRHNEMLERQEAAHQRAMERQAQEQAEAQRRAAVQAEHDRQRAQREAFQQKAAAESAARKQANATKMAGVSKCASCANSRHCPSHVKNSGAGLTCGGYRPYGSGNG